MTRRFRMRLHTSNFGIPFRSRNIKFSIHNVFDTRVLLKIFDIEFPYKCVCSYFEQFCLPAKMASETVIRPIYFALYFGMESAKLPLSSPLPSPPPPPFPPSESGIVTHKLYRHFTRLQTILPKLFYLQSEKL